MAAHTSPGRRRGLAAIARRIFPSRRAAAFAILIEVALLWLHLPWAVHLLVTAVIHAVVAVWP
jgi:hypothetical protein